jgi:tetratricopeptide (TPR) repeat protein
MRSTAELVERSPNDPQRLFDHAQNVFWMGELSRTRGRMDQAEAAYREYKRLADRMVASDPANPKWRMEETYAKENIGIVLDSQRRFTEAAREFDAALPTLERLAANNPGNADYQGELSTMLAWLADARRDEGRMDLAILARRKQIALLREQLSAGKTDVQLKEKLIPAQQALGILLADTGNSRLAIDAFQAAIADSETLIAIEPENATWRGLAASVRLELANTLLAVGRTPEATAEADSGCALATMLRKRDPNVAMWRSFVTNCRMVRARLALAGGSPADALALSEQALQSARNEGGVDPIRDKYRIAAAYRLIGEIHRRIGEKELARAAWSAGLAQLPANVNERPREMNERAGLLRDLGKAAEARMLTDKLRAGGFIRRD